MSTKKTLTFIKNTTTIFNLGFSVTNARSDISEYQNYSTDAELTVPKLDNFKTQEKNTATPHHWIETCNDPVNIVVW